MYKLTLKEDEIGEIQIDDFKESFESDLLFWSKAEYEQHWVKAGDKLSAGNSVSFITSITYPNNTSFIFSWSCYPIDGQLVFQERVLILDDLDPPFDLNHPEKNLKPYEAYSDDGDKISEWRTTASRKI